MKLLKIYNRDKTAYENIWEFTYNSLGENRVNEVTIYKNPKEYENKVVEVWDFGEPRVAGIVKRYTWSDTTKEGKIFIYPLIIDLQDDWIIDENLADPWNKIFYISSSIEGVLEEILDQYLASTEIPNKLLSKGTFATTGRNVRFTFYYASLYDALRFLTEKMLTKWYYIKVDVTGRVDLVNITNVIDLKNDVDIENIDFEERVDENIKTIIFDNKSSENHILKTYTNPNPSVTHGKVKYIKDARFKDVDSVDNYVEAYFEEKGSPKVDVTEIITDIDVPLYSKVNIYNWDKNFGDIYVVGKNYLSNGKINLKLWTDEDFKVEMDDEVASLEEEIQVAVSEIPDLPSYIEESKITSTTIESPTIAGNSGLFSWVVKVGANGITIDGTNKKIFSNNFTAGSSGWSINNDGTAEFNDVTIRSSIFSSNYNLSNKTGWGILENGEFLFGQNSNNYIQNDGTNFIFSGKMVAKAGSSIEWDYIDNAPENDWENPSYIKSTYIDQTSIVSPTVSGNNGYFSGTFKVGTNGIIIDGSAKTIRSDNYSPWNDGWIIKNNGDVEFQDGVFRGEIDATSGSLTGAFRIQSPWYIEVYEDSNNRILIGLLWGVPTLQFLDGGDYVGDIKGENNKTLSIGGTSVTLDCISFSEDVYIGRDLAIQDDIVVNDDAYVGGTIYCQGKLRVPVGTNLY